MGNKICVCDGDIHNEKESNIFSIFPQTKNIQKEELKTLTLENKITQGSNYKSFIIDDNSSINNKLDNFLSEIYRSKNNSQQLGGETIPENKKEDNNFRCSGKFKISEDQNPNNIQKGKNNIDNDSLNNKENKEINDKGLDHLKKNEFGFVSFKSLIVDNNHNIQLKENKQNKDNNMTVSNECDKIKEAKENEDNKKDYKEIINEYKIKNNVNGGSLNERNVNYSQMRYNDISKYSDVSDEDYLNYESNYTNSNQREENRDEQSLFDESQGDNL